MSMVVDNLQIRILHVLGSLDRGGAETMIMNLYRNIDRSKVQFDFLIHTDRECDYNEEIRSIGGKIYSLKRFKGYNLCQYIKQFKDFFIKHPEYEIIHGHMRSTASIYLKIAKSMGRYTIAHSHNTSSGNGISALGKNLIQLPLRYIADYYFACSIEAGEWLFGKKIIKSDKFYILKNAIDMGAFVFNQNIRDLKRKELGFEDFFIIGNVGRFHEQKNHYFTLNLFNEFLKEELNSKLVLVGEGELKSEIKKYADELEINDKVIFLDSRSDINELMMSFDVFIFPSKYEGLGIVAIEAQSSSLPTLCSDNVPREVKITDIIRFISLDDMSKWIKELKKIKNSKRKIIKKEDVVKTGYDIKSSSAFLFKFYVNIYKNKF